MGIANPKAQQIEERLINFAVRILTLTESLPSTPAGSHLANQLLRCGTSPAANYAEARAAESNKDFIHKQKIALNELRETPVWLKIIEHKTYLSPAKLSKILPECDELISIFVASLKTLAAKK